MSEAAQRGQPQLLQVLDHRKLYIFRLIQTYISNVAYLPVHFALPCVENPHDSAAIPVVFALFSPK